VALASAAARPGGLRGKLVPPTFIRGVRFGGVGKNRPCIRGTTSLHAVLAHVNGALVP
jgi:hypothetical protein